jgi:CRP-like cAMP-binding protein
MSSGEFFGYIASGLVFVTFYMRTMLPLRLVAIGSNVAFITYALIDDLTPILILHGALLPLNVLRLLELRELAAKVERAAADSFSPQAILPFMKKQVVRANEVLFSIRDEADALYYIVEGEIFLPEIQEALGPGAFLGEFALFSSSGRRTATAIARTDSLVMVLSKKAVFTALLLHPQLGIHLLKLVTVRLLQNGGLREDQLAPIGDPPAKVAAPLDRRLMERLGRRGRRSE